jgi:hypothetical protein
MTQQMPARPPDSLERRYAVNFEGLIYYVENWAQPGYYLCQRLDFKGTPIDSKLTPLKELAKMTLYTNLREARSQAAVTACKYASLKARFEK